MLRWLRRIRGAVGMGVSWSFAWAVAVVLLGVTSIFLPGVGIIFEAADDELLPMMVVLAFAGGVTFSAALAVAGRRRRFDELSLPRFAAWGAVGGLLLSLLPATVFAVETANVAQAVVVVATVSLLSAVSAAGSLMMARVAEDRDLLDAGEEAAGVGLTGDEARELLGGRNM